MNESKRKLLNIASNLEYAIDDAFKEIEEDIKQLREDVEILEDENSDLQQEIDDLNNEVKRLEDESDMVDFKATACDIVDEINQGKNVDTKLRDFLEEFTGKLVTKWN